MRKLFLLIFIGFICFAITSCSHDDVIPENINTEEIDGLTLGNGMIRQSVNVSEPKVTYSSSAVESTVLNNLPGVLIKRTRIYKAGVAYDEYLLFNPMNSYMYPGLVFVGNSIASGQYIPVKDQETGDITISTDLVPLVQGMTFAKTITNGHYSDYMKTLQEWRSAEFKDAGAMTTYEVSEIFSNREAQLKAGVAFQNPNASVAFDIDVQHKRMKTHVLVKFVQKVFSISMDIPKGCILKNINIKNLNNVMPVYISDIFYGRMAYALISSNHSYSEVAAALKIFIPKANLTPSLELKYKEILDKALMKQTCIGGTPEQHGKLIKEGWQGFKDALAAPIPVSSALPIAFSLKYADDNSVARVLQTGEYPVVESHFIPKCEAVDFTFRAALLKGTTGTKKNNHIHGSSKIILPDGQEITLFSVDKKDYIKIDKEKEFIDIEKLTSNIDVIVKRPAEMSMEDFMKQKVTIITQLKNTGAYGIVEGDNLGKSTIEIELRDLIFNAESGQLIVETAAKRVLNYTGALGFLLQYKTVH